MIVPKATMFPQPYRYRVCDDCGLAVPENQLVAKTHVCNPASLLAHQTLKARQELSRLEVEVAEYLQTPRAQNLLAFERWCRAHGR